MVAQEILDLLVWVRALVPEPFFYLGAMVKRLRRRLSRRNHEFDSRWRYQVNTWESPMGHALVRMELHYIKHRTLPLGTSFLFAGKKENRYESKKWGIRLALLLVPVCLMALFSGQVPVSPLGLFQGGWTLWK